MEKYNKRIIEAVQSWIQQLRTPVRDSSQFCIVHALEVLLVYFMWKNKDWKQKESELPSSDPVSMDDTSDKELADKVPYVCKRLR